MPRTKRTDPAPEATQEPSTALALPDTPILVAAFSAPEKMEAILTRIETEVRAVAPDLSTVTSRKAIASLAFKVARSKTALDDIGKDITEDARKQIDAVNAKRRDIRDRLDALKNEVRAPLDEWEAAEEARVADLEDRLKDFTDDLPTADMASEAIATVLGEIKAIPVDATWAEFEQRAAEAKTNAVQMLTERLAIAQQREAERAELERLRAEAAAREAAEQRRLIEERRKAEAERIEREKAEAAERAARAAEERAERESREREARHQREIAAAEARLERERSEAAAREEQAAARERERIAAEQAKAEAERRAREADQARRAQVDLAIREALIEAVEIFAPGNPSDPALHWEDALGHAVDLIMAGRIPHVKVEM
jgi:chromosome segregation ATPase